MNPKSTGKGSQLPDRLYAELLPVESAFDQDQDQLQNKESSEGDSSLLLPNNFSNKNLSLSLSTSTISGRNKRKNFSPKYTSVSVSNKNCIASERSPENVDNRSSGSIRDYYPQMDDGTTTSTFPKSPRDDEHKCMNELPPWIEILNHCSQLNKAMKLTGCQQVSIAASRIRDETASSEIDEWVRNFCSRQSTVSAFRDLLKAYSYQQKGYWSGLQDNNSDVKVSKEIEPPTPPKTPHSCNPQRFFVSNGGINNYCERGTIQSYDNLEFVENEHSSTNHSNASMKGDSLFLTKRYLHRDGDNRTANNKLKADTLLSSHLRQWYGDLKLSNSKVKKESDEIAATEYPSIENISLSKDCSDLPTDVEEDDFGYQAERQMECFSDSDKSHSTSAVHVTFKNNAKKTGKRREINLKRMSVKNSESSCEKSVLSTSPSNQHRALDEKKIENSIENFNKFASYLDCNSETCRSENIREHYHCYDFPCGGKILFKKEEVIRHVKWHRKRSESLNYGFMRFSSSDDCSATFGSKCQHNRKQTHYHCFQPHCDRVYISTSDVQMHFNFHRKDSAILKQGFQRFRANENCTANYCTFADQKTTHFHCRWGDCQYTFKNKADMEKHKAYHIKDIKLVRDGFKKFLKNEPCLYKNCRFSMVCNHIHCARENCFYVLHSSGQLLSHKRKHERIDNEQTYSRYKMLAVKAALLGNTSTEAITNTEFPPTYNANTLRNSLLHLKELKVSTSKLTPAPNSESVFKSSKSESAMSSSYSMEVLRQINTDLTSAAIYATPTRNINVSILPKLIFGSNHSAVSFVQQQFVPAQCPVQTSSTDEPTNLTNTNSGDGTAEVGLCMGKEQTEPRVHCNVTNCESVIPNNFLDISAHIRMHGYNRTMYPTSSVDGPSTSFGVGKSHANSMQITTIDGFFNRKRGRPPKNRFVEVYKNAQQSPQAIFTSFKLEKQTLNKDYSLPQQMNTIQPSQRGTTFDDEKHRQNRSPQHFAETTQALAQSPVGLRQLTSVKADETCRFSDIPFTTIEGDLLRGHSEKQQTDTNFLHTLDKRLKSFDRNTESDCEIAECRQRKTGPHSHCHECNCQISPIDIETHICGGTKCAANTSMLSDCSTERSKIMNLPSGISTASFTIRLNKKPAKNLSNLASVTLSTSTPDLRRKTLDEEQDVNLIAKQRLYENEKVSIVRASGTYFPENTHELTDIVPNEQCKRSSFSSTAEYTIVDTSNSNQTHCSVAYCKLKGKPHEYCSICDQPYLDAARRESCPLTTVAKQNSGKGKEINVTQPTTLDEASITPTIYDDQPQDLSLPLSSTTKDDLKPLSLDSRGYEFNPDSEKINASLPGLMCNMSMQNLHLAHLATLYQKNPFYCSHLYPLLSNAVAFTQQQTQAHRLQYMVNKQCAPAFSKSPKPTITPSFPASSPESRHLAFLDQLLLIGSTETITRKEDSTSPNLNLSDPLPPPSTAKTLKRKFTDGSEDLHPFTRITSPTAKKQVEFSIPKLGMKTVEECLGISHDHRGKHFKIKDEQIPSGYLKFRFNEDCCFLKCGYRNHQSHFHCDRSDCHYSFCDKTRFVQHTARHERLDKLMGNDFRQYRANMNCGYDNCPHLKNLESSNKSSHFHCLKCDFICSDTNKVVAHRRQHSKMEYIRMVGFRKVANTEKCNSAFETSIRVDRPDVSCVAECSYSQKQTHYHCLVCDVSVLSRAQLASHKHKI